jgi:hypothetical protein
VGVVCWASRVRLRLRRPAGRNDGGPSTSLVDKSFLSAGPSPGRQSWHILGGKGGPVCWWQYSKEQEAMSYKSPIHLRNQLLAAGVGEEQDGGAIAFEPPPVASG